MVQIKNKVNRAEAVQMPIDNRVNTRNIIPVEIIELERKIKHAQNMITDFKTTRLAIAYLDKIDERFGCYEARNATVAIDEISKDLLTRIRNTKFDENNY